MSASLNENIKQLRIQRGLSQVDLAKSLNVSKQCVSNWENDNVRPSVDMLTNIADYFDVSTDYLLGRQTDYSISVSGLTQEQCSHIRLLINDLRSVNK